MSFTDGLVDRATRFATSRLDRRDLFRRAAMAGTAMVVAPTTFALERTSAYAAVCSCSGSLCPCGSQCCDGYTEFCCTITGRNACPTGTFLAGWWKVDGSSYCGGGARYYLDCNSQCGGCTCGSNGICSGSCSGTPCGCARGDCNHRKAGCTHFRYGQCHNEMRCLGPIVCRVVSCLPPWQLDATCSTAALVDNATRFHNAECLQGFAFGSIDAAARVPGGYRVRGWAADPDATGPVDVHVYANGALAAYGTTDVARPDVTAYYPAFTWPTGYDLFIPSSAIADASTVNVCVYGINVGFGANGLLGCRTIDSSPQRSLELVERVPGGVRMKGWAVDMDDLSPVEIHAYLNGGGHNLGVADRPRPDVAAALGLGTDEWGFDFVLPVTVTGSLEVCLYAINKGPGANVTFGCATFTNADAPVGSVDRVERVAGGIRVAGWAWDPDEAPEVTIRATVGSQPFVVGPTSVARPDVAARFPGAPTDCGFDAVLPVDPPDGPVTVCVEAVDPQGGTGRQLGCRTLQIADNPTGNVESLVRSGSQVRAIGWALDREAASPVEIHLLINGGGHNTGPADRNRPDVAAAFPSYGPLHGFDKTVGGLPTTGPLIVEVWAIGLAGSPNTLLQRQAFS